MHTEALDSRVSTEAGHLDIGLSDRILEQVLIPTAINPLPTNDAYMMCRGCTHFFHKSIRICVLILGVNAL